MNNNHVGAHCSELSSYVHVRTACHIHNEALKASCMEIYLYFTSASHCFVLSLDTLTYSTERETGE